MNQVTALFVAVLLQDWSIAHGPRTSTEHCKRGSKLGESDTEGRRLGIDEGMSLGRSLGINEGSSDGLSEGWRLGNDEGWSLGRLLGNDEG